MRKICWDYNLQKYGFLVPPRALPLYVEYIIRPHIGITFSECKESQRINRKIFPQES
jgi:hypothetical protein